MTGASGIQGPLPLHVKFRSNLGYMRLSFKKKQTNKQKTYKKRTKKLFPHLLPAPKLPSQCLQHSEAPVLVISLSSSSWSLCSLGGYAQLGLCTQTGESPKLQAPLEKESWSRICDLVPRDVLMVGIVFLCLRVSWKSLQVKSPDM